MIHPAKCPIFVISNSRNGHLVIQVSAFEIFKWVSAFPFLLTPHPLIAITTWLSKTNPRNGQPISSNKFAVTIARACSQVLSYKMALVYVIARWQSASREAWLSWPSRDVWNAYDSFCWSFLVVKFWTTVIWRAFSRVRLMILEFFPVKEMPSTSSFGSWEAKNTTALVTVKNFQTKFHWAGLMT